MTLDLTEFYRDDECIQYECGAYDELLVFEELVGPCKESKRYRVYLSGEPFAWCDAYTMSRYTASASFPEAPPMTRRHWRRDVNDIDRQERRDLVLAAGSHRRWAMSDSDLSWYLDTAIGFDVRCPRLFRAAMKRLLTELEARNSDGEECPF